MIAKLLLLSLTALVHSSPTPYNELSWNGNGGNGNGGNGGAVVYLPNGCPADGSVFELLPDERDCNSFYYCVWGERVKQSCPAGLHFNPTIQVCDYPQTAGCKNANGNGDNGNGGSGQGGNGNGGNGHGGNGNGGNGHGGNGNGGNGHGGNGNGGNGGNGNGSNGGNGNGDSGNGGNGGAVGYLPNGCPADGQIFKLLPNERDCNSFYYCVWGERVKQSCPAGLHFNPTIQVCDYPQTAGCKNANGNGDNGNGGSGQGGNGNGGNGHGGNGNGGNGHGGNGNGGNGHGGNGNGGNGGNGNGSNGGNGNGDSGNGGNGGAVGYLPNGCPADGQIFKLLPNDRDCNSFYYCVWGERVKQSCPAGLHFNPTIQVCDYPQTAGCKNANGNGDNGNGGSGHGGNGNGGNGHGGNGNGGNGHGGNGNGGNGHGGNGNGGNCGNGNGSNGGNGNGGNGGSGNGGNGGNENGAGSDGVVTCYWGSWANQRNSSGRFGVSDLPIDLCSHIIFSFVAPTAEGEVIFSDAQNSIEGKSNLISDFTALKTNNADLKLLVAIGGWTAGSDNFTIIVNNDTLRATFVDNVYNFLVKHDLDGADLDWEYPAQRGGADTDKEQFVVLLKELKEKFKDKSFLLTAAVAVTQAHIDLSYNVTELNLYLDYIHLMNYDYHGAWDNVTGVNAPLYAQLTDASGTNLNVNNSVYTWIENGADPAKIVLGIGAYGKTFTLTSLNNTSTGAPFTAAGEAGPYTAEAGTWAYFEICQSQQNESSAWSITEVSGNYVYGNLDLFWVGYDNVNTTNAKGQYAKETGLGGIMFWSLDNDDFRGLCGEVYPIVKAGIRGYNN